MYTRREFQALGIIVENASRAKVRTFQIEENFSESILLLVDRKSIDVIKLLASPLGFVFLLSIVLEFK